jgi:hypothetical protein
VCGSSKAADVLALPGLPIAINAQVRPDQALSVARGDMELVVCRACSQLYNRAFDPDASAYDSSYENSLHFSPRFRDHARSLASRLVADHELTGSTVAEVGAGPGHFLTMLCEAGAARGFGFDPSYDPDRLGAPEHPAVTLSASLFPDDGSITAKLAISQHVLEHLEDPVGLLRSLRAAVATEPGGVVYSEVPNGEVMIDRCALWDLIYEHYSYFTPVSLRFAAARAGLSAGALTTMFDDQFLALESSAMDGDGSPAQAPGAEMVDPLVERSVVFGRQARTRIAQAQSELARYLDEGPVALWGAGSKGRTYLNVVAPEGQIGAIIDVNPRKDGYGIPGVPGIIRRPESLRTVRPATVLIANPVYTDEIKADLGELGVEAEVLPLWV